MGHFIGLRLPLGVVLGLFLLLPFHSENCMLNFSTVQVVVCVKTVFLTVSHKIELPCQTHTCLVNAPNRLSQPA